MFTTPNSFAITMVNGVQKTEIIDRVVSIMDYFDLTNVQFSRKTGISKSAVDKYRSGERGGGLNSAAIAKILTSFPDISATWLILGTGEMIIKPQEDYIAELKKELKMTTEQLELYKRIDSMSGGLDRSKRS